MAGPAGRVRPGRWGGRLLAGHGLSPGEIDSALDPAGYLGAASEFAGRALAAHRHTHARLAGRGR